MEGSRVRMGICTSYEGRGVGAFVDEDVWHSIALAPPFFRQAQKEIIEAPTPPFIEVEERILVLNSQ